jgi:hypothetical protein
VTKITCRVPLKALSRCHLSRILVLPTCRSVKSRWLSLRRGKVVPYRVKYELEPSCLRFEFTSQAEFGISLRRRQCHPSATASAWDRSRDTSIVLSPNKAASTRRVSYRQFGTIHFEPRVCESLRGPEVLQAQVGGKFLINYIVKGAPYECPKLGTYIWCGTSNLALMKGTKLDKSRLLYEARQATRK